MIRPFSRFADRTEGGKRLAALLERRGIDADSVLAVARGGLPVGRIVADALGADLDVTVTRTIGAPDTPELTIGSVAADGSLWLDDRLVDRLGVSNEYVTDAADREIEAARENRDRYRGDRDPPEYDGETVLVVDDGITTGTTIAACVEQARTAGAERVVVAVPVAPPDTVESLREVAEDAVAVMTPAGFGAVGRFYESFEQVSDEAAMDYLD